jgi:hypothetical protein
LRAWIDRVEDLSGHGDSEWLEHESIAAHLQELLQEIGRTYVPFLIANARAFADGKNELDTTIDGQRWVQPVFPYQVKCLETLQQEKNKMTPDGQVALSKLFTGTGCELLFT